MTESSNLSDEALLELLTLTVEFLPNGSKIWRNSKGLLHREFGPAFEWSDGQVEYYINGKRHRVGGPAVIHANGAVEYWCCGVYGGDGTYN